MIKTFTEKKTELTNSKPPRDKKTVIKNASSV